MGATQSSVGMSDDGGAMAPRRLPEEGELRLGSVTLPRGKLITADYGEGDPVAWATVDPVPEPGRVWAALSDAYPQTGLVPILLDSLDGDGKRPWDRGEFGAPADMSRLDLLEAGGLLEALWDDSLPSVEDEAENPYFIRARMPFTRQFPGLAPPAATPWPLAARQDALDFLLPRMRGTLLPRPAARIGLVAASRPADVLAAIGWGGVANRGHDFLLTVVTVLRSWEDRFGARLLDVGFADVRLLVERPPRTLAAAERIAAEHYVFCDECSGEGLKDIPSIAASLVLAPVWAFWWD
jgi:Domain of unknown function (DUF4253)